MIKPSAFLENSLKKNFLIRLHPTLKLKSSDVRLPNNVKITFDFLSNVFSQSCLLITDYSGVVFDYVLHNKQASVIFYCPDFVRYQENPGIQSQFFLEKIGPKTETIEELEQVLKSFDATVYQDRYTLFAAKWNKYNDGKAQERLLSYIKVLDQKR